MFIALVGPQANVFLFGSFNYLQCETENRKLTKSNNK